MPKIGYNSHILPDDYTFPMPEPVITLPYVQKRYLDNEFVDNQYEEIKRLRQVIETQYELLEMQGEVIKEQRKRIFILSGKRRIASKKKGK